MALSHSPNIVTDGLVLCLDAGNKRSYPGSGTVWRDLSGNGNDGTLVNGVGYSGDGSLSFDGVNDYVNNGTSFANLTTQLTICFWGKITGNPNDGILITKGEHNESSTSNFGFQIRPSGRLRLYAKAPGQSYTIVDSNNNIMNNNTNLYTITFNLGIVSFYKNGILHSSHSFGLSTLPSTVGPLYVGALKGYHSYYPGSIYGIQIYNRALSFQEVLQNYNATKGRFGL